MSGTRNTLSPGEAARAIGISERYLLTLANQGRIRHERTAIGRLYDANDVERFRDERARHPRIVARPAAVASIRPCNEEEG